VQLSSYFAEFPLILASGSPRRKDLLAAAEIPFNVLVSDAVESYPDQLAVERVPEFIATNKALATADRADTESVILAADTVVVIDNKIIGKPEDAADAVRMLHLLSGRTHHVYTGVVILQGDRIHGFTEITEVEFYPLSSEAIGHYVNKFSPLDKAGAYGIQEWIGYIGVKKITGDYYNVMGLPISRVVRELQDFLQGRI
jgi:septum formation protein